MLKSLSPIDVALIKKIGGNGSSYTLPIASSTQLGGVKPVTKTDAMTQEVGVDEAGGLWAKAGSGGGGSSAELLYSYTVPEDNVAISSTSFAISPAIEAWKYTNIFVDLSFIFSDGVEEGGNVFICGKQVFSVGYFRRASGGKSVCTVGIQCTGDSAEYSAANPATLIFFSRYKQSTLDFVSAYRSGKELSNTTNSNGMIDSIGFTSENGFVLNSGSTIKIYGIRRSDM